MRDQEKAKSIKELGMNSLFKGQLEIGKESELVANPFTGESVTLEPDAVAVYDLVMGAEFLDNNKLKRLGLDWFRKYYPKEYYILLD